MYVLWDSQDGDEDLADRVAVVKLEEEPEDLLMVRILLLLLLLLLLLCVCVCVVCSPPACTKEWMYLNAGWRA